MKRFRYMNDVCSFIMFRIKDFQSNLNSHEMIKSHDDARILCLHREFNYCMLHFVESSLILLLFHLLSF